MAQMLPPSLTLGAQDRKISQGEKDVFNYLADSTPPDWIVLHSLNLKNHEYKKAAEADFVIISNVGVFVVEVKGGEIRRDENGVWVQEKAGEEPWTSKEGPFKQASGAYFAIANFLKKTGNSNLINNLVWGWGVILPHCKLELSFDDPEIDESMLLDISGFPEDFPNWINGLASYWRNDHASKNRRDIRNGRTLQESVSASARKQLNQFLRPKFEKYSGLGTATRLAEQEIIRFSNSQCELLAYAHCNPRMILKGSAGTGKTLLAFRFAQRCAEAGEKVLLICYNVNLGTLLARDCAATPGMNTVICGNYHQIISMLCKQVDIRFPHISNWRTFNEQCVDLVIDVIEKQGQDFEFFDRIIIDEGQDLMTEAFMDVINLLLKDGLYPPKTEPRKGGKWFIALDEAQAIYSDNFEPEVLDDLERCNPAIFTLEKNCRNTREVAEYVYGFSGAGSRDVLQIDGPKSEIFFFKDQNDLLKKLRKEINDTINEYSRVDIPANEIALLTARIEMIPDALLEPGTLSRRLARYPDAREENVVWETIHGFKGLEASTVILLGVEELDQDYVKQLIYIGGSRAKTRLIWFFPDICLGKVQEQLIKIQLGSAGNTSAAG